MNEKCAMTLILPTQQQNEQPFQQHYKSEKDYLLT
jgi:hypothetical protein